MSAAAATPRAVRAVLTIAGSDPSGGAGIQADLKTFAALGVYGTSAVTAITVQNTRGVTDIHSLPPVLVADQIAAIASDITLYATKVGMLATAAIVGATVATITALELPLVVVDPVMFATSGMPLLDQDGVQALRTDLLPLAHVVTPNIREAEVLSGLAIQTVDDVREAAMRIHRLGPAVIVTGGHLPGRDVVDVLFDGRRVTEWRTPRIETIHTHGSGCTFASAVAAHLALGANLVDATARAQAYVAGAIRHAITLGHGCGPLGHFWRHDTQAEP